MIVLFLLLYLLLSALSSGPEGHSVQGRNYSNWIGRSPFPRGYSYLDPRPRDGSLGHIDRQRHFLSCDRLDLPPGHLA
jgi:hypothetical protein